MTHLESQSFLSVTWNKSRLERDGNGTAKVNIADQNRLVKIDFLYANLLLVDDEGNLFQLGLERDSELFMLYADRCFHSNVQAHSEK